MNYQKIYDQLIDRAKKESRKKGSNTYYESHHILPKCMGGEGRTTQWKWHPNIVLLTAREHFIAHLLLCEIYSNPKLVFALWRMCNNKGESPQERTYNVSSRIYENSRRKFTEEIKSKLTGISKPEGFGEVLSDKLVGRESYWKDKKQSPEHVEKRAVLRRGKPGNRRSKETEDKIQATRKRKKSNCKEVVQMTKLGEVVTIWGSLKEASGGTSINNSCISAVCNGRAKSAGGFIWKYKN